MKGAGQTISVSYYFNQNSCVNLTTPILMAYNASSGQLQPETTQLAYFTLQSGQVTINGYMNIAPDQKVLMKDGYQEAMNLTVGEKI